MFSKLSFIFLTAFLVACTEAKELNEAVQGLTCEQEKVVDRLDLELIPEKGRFYYQGEPFCGKSISLFPHGDTAEVVHYSLGKKDGATKKWFPNGQLSYAAYYVDGKLEGSSRSWWKNGKLRSEASYKAGVAHGELRQWYKTGELFKLRNLVNGQEEGLQRAWRQNGKLYTNYEAKNGRIFGLKRSNLCFQLDDEEIQENKSI